METVAVYWEPQIKTYGIAEKTGLSLLTCQCSAGPVDLERLTPPDGQTDDVLLAVAHPVPGGALRLQLVVAGAMSACRDGGAQTFLGRLVQRAHVTAPVDLIYFQGPHYGDRFGIAEAAFDALLSASVPVLIASCCGASVHMVLTGGQAGAARAALSQAFVVPTGTKDRLDK